MIRLLITLFVIALYLLVFALSWVYSYIFIAYQACKRRSYSYFKETYNTYMYYILWGVDQAANPVLRYMGTRVLIKPGGVPFGPVDKTLSHIFGVNKYFATSYGNLQSEVNKLYPLGRAIGAGIDWVFGYLGDKDENGKNNHLKKAATADQYNEN